MNRALVTLATRRAASQPPDTAMNVKISVRGDSRKDAMRSMRVKCTSRRTADGRHAAQLLLWFSSSMSQRHAVSPPSRSSDSKHQMYSTSGERRTHPYDSNN
jgi:hypothetical protein